jgi:hypothetical protein
MTVMVFHHARYAQICLLILKHYSISEFIANATMEIEMSMKVFFVTSHLLFVIIQ